MIELLKKLTAEPGVSGCEEELLPLIRELTGDFSEVSITPSGSIVAQMGDKNAEKHIMIDAHIDRIGLVVTYIDKKGFLSAAPVGGIDLRSLPGSAVTINGRKPVMGVICTLPPHIAKDEAELSEDKIRIDTGLHPERVRDLIAPGDTAVLYSRLTELQNGRVAVSGLDDRSGCAVLIRSAQLLRDKELPCRVSFVFSSQEETGELGAATAAFALEPDEAVVIDVGFAKQPGVSDEKSGKLGCGGIISISPVLSRPVTEKLKELASELEMEYDFEVCGGGTGTNADRISCSRSGVKTGVISIPSMNMHTPSEVVLRDDLEKLSQLIALYIERGGAEDV